MMLGSLNGRVMYRGLSKVLSGALPAPAMSTDTTRVSRGRLGSRSLLVLGCATEPQEEARAPPALYPKAVVEAKVKD